MLTTYSQEASFLECENYAVDVFKGVTMQLQDYREINGGSKLIVSYSGVWPEEMKGAFEYAIKLWEEVLPTSLPINITAKLEPIRGSREVLSKVGFHTYNFNGDFEKEIAAPSTLIKNVVLRQSHRSYQDRFTDEFNDSTLFNDEDICITYNQYKLEDFSFSLDGEPTENKYDFVTLVLRDIALGLGFGVNFTADVVEKSFNFTNARNTPYEKLIIEALNTTDHHEAFNNATKGNLKIELLDGN